MKIVKISFERCGEHEKTGYWLAPATMSEVEAQEAVAAARTKYLELVDKYQGQKHALVEVNILNFPETAKDMTIGEAKAAWEANEILRKERRRLNEEMSGSFKNELYIQGLIAIEDADPMEVLEVTVDWGHRHGLKLNY